MVDDDYYIWGTADKFGMNEVAFRKHFKWLKLVIGMVVHWSELVHHFLSINAK